MKKTRTDQEQMLYRFEKGRRANMIADAGPNHFIVVLDNLKPDFNIGKIFRSADAFGAREVHVIGTEVFDPAPSKGGFKNVPARFHRDFVTCYNELLMRDYTLYLLDPAAEKTPARESFPQFSAFVLGHEEFGFSFNPEEYSALSYLKIPQFGKVQSLNVSVAASIVMYEYIRQHK